MCFCNLRELSHVSRALCTCSGILDHWDTKLTPGSFSATYEFWTGWASSGGASLVVGSWCPPVRAPLIRLALASGSRGSLGSWPLVLPGRPLESGGHDLGGKVEVVPQILDTLVGEVPVVVAPSELLADIAAGLQGSQGLDHLERRSKIYLEPLLNKCRTKEQTLSSVRNKSSSLYLQMNYAKKHHAIKFM